MFRNAEDQHRALFEAHWLLVAGAAKLHEVLVACHANGRYEPDREKLKSVVAQLEAARSAADVALRAGGQARSELIRHTGCDGSCADKASSIVGRTLSAQKQPTPTKTNVNESATNGA